MKKCAWLIMLMLLSSAFCTPVMAMDNTVTANTDGYNDVVFSNGYNGFCLDKWFDMAYEGNEFVVTDTNAATNNISGEPIAQYLKIYFVDFFTDIFEKDNDGYYKIKDAINTQAVIYGFSDSDSKDWDYSPLTDVVEKYNSGRRIEDHGEKIVVGNDSITFDFIVMKSQIAEQQDFFGYYISVEPNVPKHEHDYGEKWEQGEETHWHECECGDKADEGSHEGNIPDCITPSTCETCGKELSELDPENHTGNTEIRNKKDPTYEDLGYTGDTYCKDCDSLLEKGEEIPILIKPTNSDTEDVDNSEESINDKNEQSEIIKPNEIKKDSNKQSEKDAEKDNITDYKKDIPDTGDNGFANLIITAVCSLICMIVMIVMVRKHYIMRNK